MGYKNMILNWLKAAIKKEDFHDFVIGINEAGGGECPEDDGYIKWSAFPDH